MSDRNDSVIDDVFDRFALHVQEMRAAGRLDNNEPLLRIDNRNEAARAPFQFDITRAVVHRTGCTAIPRQSRSALYALWDLRPEDVPFACPQCNPAPGLRSSMKHAPTTDILYGFLSILDQFGSILSERGREFRESEKGRQVETVVDRVLDGLDASQQQSITLLLSSLDSLTRALRERPSGNGSAPPASSMADVAATAQVHANGNGHNGKNGHNGDTRARRGKKSSSNNQHR